MSMSIQLRIRWLYSVRYDLLVVRIEIGMASDCLVRGFPWPSFCSNNLMTDISTLMAQLRFSEEDLVDIDVLHIEEDHLVEGSEKCLVGKVLAPMSIDHDMLIRVFKADSVWSNRYDREKRDGTENMMGKRPYGCKDSENPQLVAKKARSTIANAGHGVNERHEETPPPMALISVEAVGQPRRMP
ncbi:hypothetical protein V6N11_077249 [Hibiscus sabdariffa]|uniref:Uncharacterized protein n=1 Tax=Hibiscus sabdariffa TaxID=183260 RepID=A0ABR2TCI9_9ROSI